MEILRYGVITLLSLFIYNANAATLVFEYSSGGSSFSGTVMGDLQSDNDTFLITQAIDLTVNGVTVDVSDFYVGRFSTLKDDLVDGTPIDPSINNVGIVTLSGLFIDITICDREVCSTGLVANNNVSGFDPDGFLAILDTDTLFTDLEFNEMNWSAQIVPIPAAGWLFFVALVGLFKFSGRKVISN